MSKQLQLDLFREQHFLNSLPEHNLYWSNHSGERITDMPSGWGQVEFGSFFWLAPLTWTEEERIQDYSFNLLSSWGTFPRLHVYSVRRLEKEANFTVLRLYFTHNFHTSASNCGSGDVCRIMQSAVETFNRDRRSPSWNMHDRTEGRNYERLQKRINAVNFLRKAIRFTEGRPGKIICG